VNALLLILFEPHELLEILVEIRIVGELGLLLECHEYSISLQNFLDFLVVASERWNDAFFGRLENDKRFELSEERRVFDFSD
jgi:hypothetical protein